MRRRKNPHAVALGRLGGRATKGIRSAAKRAAAVEAARTRWAIDIPRELRPIFWREEGRMTLMEIARVLYTRAPQLIPKALNRRTALRFARSAPTALERNARLGLVEGLYG